MRARNTHMLPVSPQNYNLVDPKLAYQEKIDQFPSQRRPLASSASKSRNNNNIRNENDYENYGQERFSRTEEEMKIMLANELRNHFQMLKDEMVDSFSSMLREHKSSGKINTDEIQEIKMQITQNRKKFEDIQNNIAQVNQQFCNINALYTRELEGIKNLIESDSDSNTRGPQATVNDEVVQKQLEARFSALKQNLTNEIHNAIRANYKAKDNEAIVNELREIKHSFEDDLKRNFDIINNRVKKAEANLNEIMKRKEDYMEHIKGDFLTALEDQGMEFREEMKNLEHAIKLQAEDLRTKDISDAELNRKMEPYRRELDKLRQTIMAYQDEVTRLRMQTDKNLERLERNANEQFYMLEDELAKRIEQDKMADLLGQRVAQLNRESEAHYRAIDELKQSLSEVQEVYRLLQNEPKFNKNNDAVVRLEAKINNLQAQIQSLSLQVERKQLNGQFARNIISSYETAPKHTLPNNYSPNLSILTPTNVTPTNGMPPLYQKYSYQHSTNKDENLLAAPKSYDPNPHYQSYQPRSTTNSELSSYTYQNGNVPSLRRAEEERISSGGTPARTSVDESQKKESKYYGDPKVRSIIEEFYQRKKQTPSPLESSNRARESSPSKFTTKPGYSTSQALPAGFQANLNAIGTRKISEPEIKPVYTDVKDVKAATYPSYSYAEQIQTAPKVDPYKDTNQSHITKSQVSNLSMTYSTINPKADTSARTEDYFSPQSQIPPVEEDKKPAIVIKPAFDERSDLKREPEQNLLSSKLLNPEYKPYVPPTQAVERPLSKDLNSSRDSGRPRRSHATSQSAADTDQFQDAMDYLSDFDMNDAMDANNNIAENVPKDSNLRADTRDHNMRVEDLKAEARNNSLGPSKNNEDLQKEAEAKRARHEKILAQIDYFIHGTLSNVLNEDDDDDIFCNIDDEGYIFDENGEYVLDKQGTRVKLSPEQIEKFNNDNMLE